MLVRLGKPRICPQNRSYQLCFRRHYSSTFLKTRLLPKNPFLAGLLGGFTGVGSIALIGYAYYHYSGTKAVVDSLRVRPAMTLLGKTHDSLANNAQGQALQYLRETAKAYVSSIPFAGLLVDKAFNAIGDLILPHSEEVQTIIWKAYDDISAIIQNKENHGKTENAWRVVSVSSRLLKELTAVAIKAGQPISEKLEFERRVADASVGASRAYQIMKSGASSMAEKINDKAKGVFASRSKSDSASEVPQLEAESQETVRNLEKTK